MQKELILSGFNNRKIIHLIVSILVDVLGMSTYLIPVLGEVGDVVYAPISGITIFIMYRMKFWVGLGGGVLGFTEEILPGTDIMPTATVLWAYTYVLRKDETLKKYIEDKKKEAKILESLN
jgi:hypothetical protein